jgi:hypothetical protein
VTSEQLWGAVCVAAVAFSAFMAFGGLIIAGFVLADLAKQKRGFTDFDDPWESNPNCWCRACNPSLQRMIVCPNCGNKRCPQAGDHRHLCSGSNDAP